MEHRLHQLLAVYNEQQFAHKKELETQTILLKQYYEAEVASKIVEVKASYYQQIATAKVQIVDLTRRLEEERLKNAEDRRQCQERYQAELSRMEIEKEGLCQSLGAERDRKKKQLSESQNRIRILADSEARARARLSEEANYWQDKYEEGKRRWGCDLRESQNRCRQESARAQNWERQAIHIEEQIKSDCGQLILMHTMCEGLKLELQQKRC